MNRYDVTITTRITKTYRVEANNEAEAVTQAHEVFSVLCDEVPEKYTQDTDTVSVVSEENNE